MLNNAGRPVTALLPEGTPMLAKPVVAIALLAGLLATTQAQAAPAATVIPLGDFLNPTHVTVAPGETDLLFIVERPGVIRLLQNEAPVAQPFLDIRQFVLGKPDANATEEQGLLSMAFPANYQQTRRFYVYFTRNDGSIEISEFRRDATNRLRADASTRRAVLTIPHPISPEHQGGHIRFGPDGLLYIATGDGGALTPPGEPSRRLDNLLGKILRIDPTPSGARRYTIPPSNPYVGHGGRDEIYAYGLRNPWRFSFDGDRIAIADAGENTQEEVNFLRIPAARGVNFGWPQFEGRVVHDNTRPGPDPATRPMFIYRHNGSNCVIIGGLVVRNPSLPALNGRYIYGDLCTGNIRSFIPNVATQKAEDDRPAEISLPALSSFGVGFNGRVYTTQISGRVSRLAPPLP
jgi:glucose/arabinose dehydrogenase